MFPERTRNRGPAAVKTSLVTALKLPCTHLLAKQVL